MKTYWSSIEQLDNNPNFIESSKKEFVSSPLEAPIEESGIDRRSFMKLMAASTALATSACVRRPPQKILPYINQPEEVTFGIPNYYASTCTECAASCGTLVKTREGRPIKLEGNPEHPMNKGGLCGRGQASILNLYDPDRLRQPAKVARGTGSTSAIDWKTADEAVGKKLQELKAKGGRVRVLTGHVTSPSTQKIVSEFLSAFPKGKWVSFEPFNAESVMEAQKLSYGARVLPRYRIDKADMIVSIDSDFLGNWLSPVEFTKQFSSRRKVDAKNTNMNRMVAFESVMTLTGANSDLRIPIRPSDAAKVALSLANELVNTLKVGSVDAELATNLKKYAAETVAMESGFNPDIVTETAKELARNKGKSLVIAGSVHSQSQDALSLQLAVNLLNSLLQNDGVTVDYNVSPSKQSTASYAQMAELVKEMEAGEVDALLVYKTNPCYWLGADSAFEKAAQKVGLVVSFNDRADETAVVCDYILPDSHSLEAWGDAEPQKGLYSLVQPTIRPLFDTRSFQDSLLALNKAGSLGLAKWNAIASFHDYVKNNWRETVYKESGAPVAFDLFWDSALREGVVDTKRSARNQNSPSRASNNSALKANLPKLVAPTDGYEVVLHPSYSTFDGRSNNIPWVLELPDPITRITWDNYASVAPGTAKALKLNQGNVVSVELPQGKVRIAANNQPGLHEKVVALGLGFGRTAVGGVGNKIGQNLFGLIGFSAQPAFAGTTATVKKTGATYMLASVQDNHTMHGRPIVKEATLAEYKENPNAGNEEHEELTTLWSKYEYPGYRWGMSIDMNSCTGCNACVIACNAENNVPVVGKDAIAKGRVMHWIRIDRYYTGTPDNPQVVHQPMLCQHCENAPCETVCPVIATVHSDEGLNSQIYNRCVGTRYCANNCPYKVRRFNWFEYNYRPNREYFHNQYPRNMAQNPEVTVRGRGVMEKCTFCIQRISEAKNTAKDLGRTVKDGEVKTACQQSCPADAIQFGNINDPKAEVSKQGKNPRGYHVLAELNTIPSVTYLTKIRNTVETNS